MSTTALCDGQNGSISTESAIEITVNVTRYVLGDGLGAVQWDEALFPRSKTLSVRMLYWNDGVIAFNRSGFEVDGGSPFDSNYFAVNNMERDWTDRNFHFLLYSGDDVVVEMEGAVNGTVRVESYQFYTLNLSMGHLTG